MSQFPLRSFISYCTCLSHLTVFSFSALTGLQQYPSISLSSIAAFIASLFLLFPNVSRDFSISVKITQTERYRFTLRLCYFFRIQLLSSATQIAYLTSHLRCHCPLSHLHCSLASAHCKDRQIFPKRIFNTGQLIFTATSVDPFPCQCLSVKIS